MRRLMLSFVVTALPFLQENPVPCGREDDRERPEDEVACECYHEKDPCEDGEVKSCGAYCKKSLCGCCKI